jgi:hypothetical protein
LQDDSTSSAAPFQWTLTPVADWNYSNQISMR